MKQKKNTKESSKKEKLLKSKLASKSKVLKKVVKSVTKPNLNTEKAIEVIHMHKLDEDTQAKLIMGDFLDDSSLGKVVGKKTVDDAAQLFKNVKKF